MRRVVALPLGGHAVLICCWSAKGGSGVTVVAAGVALAAARITSTTIVDLCGDLPAAFGLVDAARIGIAEWTRAAGRVSLDELAVPVAPQLRLVPRGDGDIGSLGSLASAAGGDVVVVDAGVLHSIDAPAAQVAALADRSLLVLRRCFLGLRRATQLGVRPHGVVLLTEPGRALRATDVSDVLGAPVVAEVPVHPSISRAVDAGLLAARAPQLLVRALDGVR